MGKPNKKQIFSLLSFAASVVIFALALYVFISSVSARSRNGQAEIFGFSFAIVLTDSMSPEIKAGDLIVVKSCDITDIKEGDNAVFMGLSGTFTGKRVVHRVVGVYDDVDEYGNKSVYLETWGISNLKHDDDYVYATNFIGKEIFHSSFLGGIMSFLRTPTNWLYLIIIGGVIYFAVRQTKKIIKLVKDKGQDEGQEQAPEGQEIEVTQEVPEGLSDGAISMGSEEVAKSDEASEEPECQEEVAQEETVKDNQNQAKPNDIDEKEDEIKDIQEDSLSDKDDKEQVEATKDKGI